MSVSNFWIHNTPMPKGYTLVSAGRYTGWRNRGNSFVKGEEQFYVYYLGHSISSQPRCANDAQAYAKRHDYASRQAARAA